MKKYQITELGDWFNLKEVIEIIKKLKPNQKLEIVKLSQNQKKEKK